MRISDWSSDVCSSDLLADAQSLGHDGEGRVRFRLRGRLDAQGPRPRARRSAGERRDVARRHPRRPILRRRPKGRRRAKGHQLARDEAAEMKRLLLTALALTLAAPAHPDTPNDNVNGITPDNDGNTVPLKNARTTD